MEDLIEMGKIREAIRESIEIKRKVLSNETLIETINQVAKVKNVFSKESATDIQLESSLLGNRW